jgi:hypothetical protein
MKPAKLLKKLLSSPENVRFRDLVTLAQAYGFRLTRVSGSHHIFNHPEKTELLNLQNYKGKAKPYQIRQSLRLIGESN